MSQVPAIIERLERAELLLQCAAEPQDFADIRNMAEAARVYARQFALGTSNINFATRVKLQADRGLADCVDAGQADGTIASWGGDKSKVGTPNLASFADLGITAPQVAEARIIRDNYTADEIDELVATANAKGIQLARSTLISTARRPHVSNNAGDNEWYTPAPFVDAARTVMGDIDLDPASSNEADKLIKAGQFFTLELDGLAHDWYGRVWMNPPYAQPTIGAFCSKLGTEFSAGNVTEACVLVNNATDTAWFQGLAGHASALCFPRGRVRFWHPNKVSAPLQGQAVVYLGRNADAFRDAFATFGFVLHD